MKIRTRRQKLPQAALGWLLTLLASPASAQTIDYFDLLPEQLLKAEVISASKKLEKVSDAAAAIYVISSEDIVRSGVTTIPDALRMAPGVEVAQADSNSWNISIRGFNNGLANKLLVMIDGRTIYNPLFAGTYWEAQNLLLEDIDRIEVVRGPGGALWGANAVNGVINIITKHTKDTQGNMGKALYGNIERGTYAGRHGGSFGEDGTYRIYGQYSDRDSYPSTSAPGDANDKSRGWRSGFRTDWGDDFTLQGDAYQTRDKQTDNLFSLTAPFSTPMPVTMNYQGANLLGRWKKDFNDNSLLTVQSYLDYAHRNDSPVLQDNQYTLDAEAQYDLAQRGRHALTVGGGYRSISDDEKGTGVVTFKPSSDTFNFFNVFVQDKITLLQDELFLTLGSKFENNDYTGFEYEPNARLQWQADQRQSVWGAVSRAVRTPRQLERDVDFETAAGPGTQITLTGNKDYNSEEVIAYEVGYRNQIRDDLSLDATAFYNQYDDLAVITALPSVPVNNGVDPPYFLTPLIFENGMKGATWGGEIVSTWSARKNLTLHASYGFLAMSLSPQKGISSFMDEDLSPKHQVKLRSSWNIAPDWALDTSVYYVSPLKQDSVASYVRLDMNLGWRATENIRFNLVGQNLVGAHREFGAANGLNAAEVPRSVFGKLTWQF
ncbi:MAG: TonB-dependent receptor [Alphaproteobacteria bacterium]